MKIEQNQICKKQGHDWCYSKLIDENLYCFCCGKYRSIKELRKLEDKIKK